MSKDKIVEETEDEEVKMALPSVPSEKKDKVPEKKDMVVEKAQRKSRTGIVYIYTSFNNTIVHITDLAGNTISRFTGGQSTKQSRLKANPTVAMFVAQRIAEEAKDAKLTEFYVRIRAKTGNNTPGPGAHAVIKSLIRAGFKIISIMDTTKIARGGPKKKGGRRGRRV